MRAIILAAGEGTRLRPFTDTVPKCMVEYRGKPIIEYTLESLARAGIYDVTAVVGYRAEKLSPYPITKIVNPRFNETNMVYSLFCAEQILDGDDLLIVYGDIIFDDRVLTAIMKSEASFSIVVDREWKQLWEARMEDVLLDAETLKIAPSGHVKEVGKKPRSGEEIEGQYIGLIKIKKELIPVVRRFYHSLDRSRTYDGKEFDRMFMTTFIQEMIDLQIECTPVWIDGGWLEFDRPSDLTCAGVNFF